MSFETIAFRRVKSEFVATAKAFSCGRGDLDDFLLKEAVEFDSHGLTLTTLVYRDETQPCPCAYFSLSADAMKLTTSEAGDLGLPFKPEISFFPAVKLTRFAVDKSMQRGGLGSHLLKTIEGLVFSEHIATRLITVDALNEPDVINFYTKNKYEMSLETQKKRRNNNDGHTTIHMFKDIYRS